MAKTPYSHIYQPQNRAVEILKTSDGQIAGFSVTETLPKVSTVFVTQQVRDNLMARGINIPKGVRFIANRDNQKRMILEPVKQQTSLMFGMPGQYLERKLARALRFLRSGKHKTAPGHLVPAMAILAATMKNETETNSHAPA